MQDLFSPSLVKLVLFSPALAYAHGDDNVTAASFIGPMVGLIVFAAVVGLGKAFLRAMSKRT